MTERLHDIYVCDKYTSMLFMSKWSCAFLVERIIHAATPSPAKPPNISDNPIIHDFSLPASIYSITWMNLHSRTPQAADLDL